MDNTAGSAPVANKDELRSEMEVDARHVRGARMHAIIAFAPIFYTSQTKKPQPTEGDGQEERGNADHVDSSRAGGERSDATAELAALHPPSPPSPDKGKLAAISIHRALEQEDCELSFNKVRDAIVPLILDFTWVQYVPDYDSMKGIQCTMLNAQRHTGGVKDMLADDDPQKATWLRQDSLNGVRQVSFGRHGNLWAVDSGNHRVQVRKPTGELVRMIAGPAAKDEDDQGGQQHGDDDDDHDPTNVSLNRPAGIAVMLHGPSFFVTDQGNARVVEYDILSGACQRIVAMPGLEATASGELRMPGGLALSPDESTLAVVDALNNRIVLVPLPPSEPMQDELDEVFGDADIGKGERLLMDSILSFVEVEGDAAGLKKLKKHEGAEMPKKVRTGTPAGAETAAATETETETATETETETEEETATVLPSPSPAQRRDDLAKKVQQMQAQQVAERDMGRTKAADALEQKIAVAQEELDKLISNDHALKNLPLPWLPHNVMIIGKSL